MTHQQFHLESEKFSPTGNIVSEGIINQLGRTKLDILSILLREAVQNSWDARASDDMSVQFGIKGYFLDNDKRNFLKNTIFACTPSERSLGLKTLLDSEIPICVIALYDRGTVGLGGPTRADVIDNNEPRDFIDFLRNIGQPTKKKNSGGTYGYGKAAFYLSSHVRSICVHTRCIYKNNLESRFIASSLGEAFEANGIGYTGRHWWGRRNTDLVEPIIGNTADDFANILGLPSFGKDERGTTIMILQPIFTDGDQTPIQMLADFANDIPHKTFERISETVLWHFWPKMLNNDHGIPSMKFRVEWEGQNISIPDPENHPNLRGFVEAMRLLKNGSGSANNGLKALCTPIKNQHPNLLLGNLAIQQFNISRQVKEPTIEGDAFQSQDLSHHVALMRQPELMVKYLPGPPFVSSWVGYSGVFITNADIDEIFADSEPPTHDNWIPGIQLKKRPHKSIVKTACKLIQKEMEMFASPPTPELNEIEITPLGAFSNQLGNWLLSSTPGGYASFEPFPVKNSKEKAEQKKINNSTGEVSVSPQNGKLSAQPDINQPTFIQTAPTYNSKSRNDVKNTSGAPVDKQPQQVVGKSQINLISEGVFTVLDDQPVLKIDFLVKHASVSSGATVTATSFAVIDGAQSETEPPIGASKSKVMRWQSPEGDQYQGAESIFIPSSSTNVWAVYVSAPEDIMIGVNLIAKAEI